jgi:hypothetical protein
MRVKQRRDPLRIVENSPWPVNRPTTLGFHHPCGSEKQPLTNLLSGNGVSDECPMGLRPTKGDENPPSCIFNNFGHVFNGACQAG